MHVELGLPVLWGVGKQPKNVEVHDEIWFETVHSAEGVGNRGFRVAAIFGIMATQGFG